MQLVSPTMHLSGLVMYRHPTDHVMRTNNITYIASITCLYIHAGFLNTCIMNDNNGNKDSGKH